jgi:hypothetical protein
MEGSCEHDDEPSGSIKCWEVLEWLHNWWLLAPWVSKKELLSFPRRYSQFMKIEISYHCSQEPETGGHPEPVEYVQYTVYNLRFRFGFFLRVSSPKFWTHFSSLPFILGTLSTSLLYTYIHKIYGRIFSSRKKYRFHNYDGVTCFQHH